MSTPTPVPRRTSITIAIAPRTIWLIVGIVLGVVLIVTILNAIIPTLVALFVAIVLAEGIRPLVQRLVALRVPRAMAVLLIYLVFFIILGVLGYFLTQPLINQLTSLADNLPRYTAEVQRMLDQAQRFIEQNPTLQRLVSALGGSGGQSFAFLLQVPMSIASLLFNIVMVLTIAFFWINSIDRLKPFVLGLLPAQTQSEAADILGEMGLRVGGYLRGLAINMTVIGVVSGAGMAILGVPYALLLGIFAGLTEAIPFIGPFLGGAAAALVALAVDGPFKALQVVIIYVVIQQLEGSVLVPIVMNRVVQLNPFLILLAVLIGGSLLGIIGSVLAVPFAVIIEIVVQRVLAPLAREAAARYQQRLVTPEESDSLT